MAAKEMYVGCPVQHARSFLGGKWQIGILWHLKDGPIRFSAVREALPGLSEKVLTENLRFFESAGIVEKQLFASIPPKVEYRLTPDGETLIPILKQIIGWSYRHMQDEKITRKTHRTPVSVIHEIEATLVPIGQD